MPTVQLRNLTSKSILLSVSLAVSDFEYNSADFASAVFALIVTDNATCFLFLVVGQKQYIRCW